MSQVIPRGTWPPDQGFRLLVLHFVHYFGLSQGLADVPTTILRVTWQSPCQQLLMPAGAPVGRGLGLSLLPWSCQLTLGKSSPLLGLSFLICEMWIV